MSNSAPNAKQPTLWREIKKNASLYLFISPFFIFGLFPVLFSFYLAFHTWDGLGEMKFVGLRNFELLWFDPDFLTSVINTLIIWIESTVPQLILALVLAFLLNAAFIRFKNGLRAVYFLPNITSIVAVTIVFGSFFGTEYGLINAFFRQLGLEPIAWLNSPDWIKTAISVMVIWRWTGYNTIIYLAGLQSIPYDLYEAAKIDGANWRQIFTHITLPLLRPVILFTVILSTIGGLQIFTEAQVLTSGTGGVGNGGLTLVFYLYKQAFENHYYGYASAVAWMLFLMIVGFSIVNWKLTMRKES
ncbi:carbohydrate ABC transporter permease [Laceyella putida]|uniref:Carbohydrate ABC transporter permease n=1 Tax=Laceyella putida TaxID=110101 RepID=A0ABW2RLZ2_9BACL